MREKKKLMDLKEGKAGKLMIVNYEYKPTKIVGQINISLLWVRGPDAQSENKASKGKNWRKKEQIFELWDNLKWHNINVIGVQKVGIGEKYLRKYWPKFFKFDQNENPPIQEAEHSPSSRNMKKKKQNLQTAK